jgi:hypothetical protein
MSKVTRIVVTILLLIVGGGIYATCRQEVIFLAPFGNTAFLEWIKVEIPDPTGNGLIYFLVFCLPDALWYMALLLSQKPFYDRGTAHKWLFYMAVALPFVFELLQYFHVIPGTPDLFDLVTFLFTLLLFLVIWKKNQRKHRCSYNSR